jgi:hypothetical protein
MVPQTPIQLFFVQPQTLLVPPPPQVFTPVQLQLTLPPQPLSKVPHCPAKSFRQVFSVQEQVPVLPGVVALQILPEPEQGQSILPPLPSLKPVPH